MTDGELKAEFKKLDDNVARSLVLIVLFVMLCFVANTCMTYKLICSADNPPKACKE